MRQVLLGVLLTLVGAAGVGAWLWFKAPEHLPAEWRRQNPQSPEYRPTLYRWKDDAGRTQFTDQPPSDRRYEEVSVDPATNVVPGMAPPPD